MEQIKKIYTVTELNQTTKKLLESFIGEIWVEGEVSNFKSYASGNIYFTLKDNNSQIEAVIYKSYAYKLKFTPENGMQILAYGEVNIFVKGGKYQLIVYQIEPRGRGALQIAFEQLKEKLENEGLFSPEHKKKLPLLPQKIAVVTSLEGAAIRDILNVMKRRFANLHILIYPVHVQGELAAGEIAVAIKNLNKYCPDVDVIILARGGGSLEDLWPFNEEIVARAIYASKIPVVSAVGHEIDFTISDFVSDLRAPTPSAAAELVVGNKEEFEKRIEFFEKRLISLFSLKYQTYLSAILQIKQNRFFRHPSILYEEKESELDSLSQDLINYMEYLINQNEQKVKYLDGKLNTLSPFSVLKRGYSIVRKIPENFIITESKQVAENDEIEITLSKGKLWSQIKKKEEK